MAARQIRELLLLLTLTAASGGCSLGPKSIERTHGQYAESVRRVESEQLLRQIVLLRYHETGVGLDVSNIAAQYEVGTSVEARPFFIAPNPSNSNIIFRTFTAILPDVVVSGTARPTISMTPNIDGETSRRFLTPITLETLVFLTQTSWPVDTVMRLWVDRLNGVPNASTVSGPEGNDAPDHERFVRICELIRSTQQQELATIRAEDQVSEIGGPLPAEAVTASAMVEAAKNGFEYRPRPDGKTWSLTRKERKLAIEVSPGAESAPEILELMRILNLAPGKSRYELVIANRGGPDPLKFPSPPSGELRVVPRSISQAAHFLSAGVEVPTEHVCAGLVQSPNVTAVTRGLFTVHTCRGHKPPPTAFAAIKYRGYWFYIEDSDHESKSSFALMLHLSRLDFARDTVRGPALTLPVGR